ncbi:uncharacterized protein VTP21DRAFT_10976 [Calcarisporiella thermophila]|uniref:uncharacterized protein n=1 Tax=Calcarisporiella thermophila TaxID=911321 RepID=UPI00374313C4
MNLLRLLQMFLIRICKTPSTTVAAAGASAEIAGLFMHARLHHHAIMHPTPVDSHAITDHGKGRMADHDPETRRDMTVNDLDLVVITIILAEDMILMVVAVLILEKTVLTIVISRTDATIVGQDQAPEIELAIDIMIEQVHTEEVALIGNLNTVPGRALYLVKVTRIAQVTSSRYRSLSRSRSRSRSSTESLASYSRSRSRSRSRSSGRRRRRSPETRKHAKNEVRDISPPRGRNENLAKDKHVGKGADPEGAQDMDLDSPEFTMQPPPEPKKFALPIRSKLTATNRLLAQPLSQMHTTERDRTKFRVPSWEGNRSPFNEGKRYAAAYAPQLENMDWVSGKDNSGTNDQVSKKFTEKSETDVSPAAKSDLKGEDTVQVVLSKVVKNN